jgi:subtilase family serine protease
LSGAAWTRLDALAASDSQSNSGPATVKYPLQGYPRTSPTDIMPAGNIRGAAGARFGVSLTQIRHLYGLDLLDPSFNPSFPLYSNTGDFQNIVVIGAPATEVNDVPNVRTGNINRWSAAEGVGGTAVGENNAEDLTLNDDPNFFGDIETTTLLEWAHGMAPAANLFTEYVNTNDGVISTSDLKIGIQAAIDLINSLPTSGPFNAVPNGGVVIMSLSSIAEVAANQAEFDALFNAANARNITFVASAGDSGGALAMPAVSPYVTSVGGTTYRVDAAGNRLSETAWLQGGGGQSTTEPLPSYQSGLKLGKKALTGGRAVPDLAMAARTRQNGIDVYWDPTPLGNSPTPWYAFEGTSGGAAMFGGAIADANELRDTLGMNPIGSQLNAKMYSLYMTNPPLYFTDITAGNNTKHSATKGFDLATGMGAPRFDQLIPGLADTIGSASANVTFTGDQYAPINTPLTGPAILFFRGTGFTAINSQFVSLNLTATAADGSTSAFSFPQIDRELNNSITGLGTVTVTNVTSTGTTTTVYNVEITGKVSKLTSRKPRVTGQIFTIDPITGQRLNVGSQTIFQGSFNSN